nr:hypothetical protein PHYPA_008757 [Physcomitrium patens]
MGIDPVTHKVRSNLLIENLDLKPMVSSTLSHMSQWDRVRMEMEARLSSDYFAKSSAHGAAIFEASGTSASFIKAPSDCSMRSWKTQVSESLLRRDFGVLEKLPPCSMDLQTVLQDWEDSLHCQPMEPGLYDSQMRAKTHSGSHSGYSQTPRNDNCSGTTVTDLAARFETFPSFHQTSPSPSPLPQTSQISDSFTSSGTKLFPDLPKPNSLPSMIPEHFSPTSTLSSPFGTSPSDFMVPPPSSNCEIAFSTSPPLQLPSPTFWTSLSAPTTMGAGDLQLPSEIPELLMELHAEPAVPDLIVATVPTTTAGTPGWTSQQGLIESKDYWANMLHLVGPPASQQLSTLLSTPARLTR